MTLFDIFQKIFQNMFTNQDFIQNQATFFDFAINVKINPYYIKQRHLQGND